MNTAIALSEGPDFAAIKARQKHAWSCGDYAAVGVTLQIVGERLAEALDLDPGAAVLDVAAGNGNFSLAAARCGARVTSTDYVPELLERARERAEAGGLTLRYRSADAEALPFADASFDAVGSTFGVMFAPDQKSAARELKRVCRAGGTIALANWTPDGFIGRLFGVIGRHVPPPVGVASPARWGDVDALGELFDCATDSMRIRRRAFTFRYASAAHFVEHFRVVYGPVNRAFAALDPDAAIALEGDLVALCQRFAEPDRQALIVRSAYLEVLYRKP